MSGVLLMVLASSLFSTMFAMVKALGPDFPFVEGVFFRALFGLPMALALISRAGVGAWPTRPPLMLVRGLLGLGGMSAYFFATQRGQLAEVWFISRVQPVLVALLAPALLGERASASIAGVLGVSLAGVALVVRPGFDLLNISALTALLAAAFSASAHICVRRLNATEPPQRIVLWFTIIVLAGSGVVGASTFVMPTVRELLLLLGIAAAATAGQLTMTTAYARDTAPAVAASSYSGVVFALLYGWLFWGELPGAWSLAGGVVIIGAGLYLVHMRRAVSTPAGGM